MSQFCRNNLIPPSVLSERSWAGWSRRPEPLQAPASRLNGKGCKSVAAEIWGKKS